MPPKGKTNNPNGKPKGCKHKKTIQWEQLGDFITKEGAERAMKILNSCDDDKFLQYFNTFLEYFRPKLQRTEIKNDGEAAEPMQVNIIMPKDDKAI